jgi:RHS repeat-associated protein
VTQSFGLIGNPRLPCFWISSVPLRERDQYSDYLYDRGGRLVRLANYHSAYDDGQGVTRRLSTAFDYEYDANSNITEISQDFMGAEVVTDYGYDEINRLTHEVTCDFMNQYYYDDGGNRTKLVHMNAVYSKDGNGRIVSMLTKASASTQGLTKTYLYSNYTELTKMTASEYGGTTRDYTYEHDNAGRLTRQVQNVFSPNSTTTYNYEWDALDRMTKVQRVASGVTKTINYTYNAAGLRARRVDTSTNVTKLWTYQGNNIASVSTKSGGSFGDTSTQEWVYTVAPGLINNVLERHKANYAATTTTSEYYQYDHRGNVAAVSDANGKILRGYQYDAFGNIPFSFATGQSGAAPTDDILFTGKDLDPDTGLYYFNARWYDPEVGRFMSRTVSSPDGESAYLFCGNNPINLADVDGFFGLDLNPSSALDPNPSSAVTPNPSSASTSAELGSPLTNEQFCRNDPCRGKTVTSPKGHTFRGGEPCGPNCFGWANGELTGIPGKGILPGGPGYSPTPGPGGGAINYGPGAWDTGGDRTSGHGAVYDGCCAASCSTGDWRGTRSGGPMRVVIHHPKCHPQGSPSSPWKPPSYWVGTGTTK